MGKTFGNVNLKKKFQGVDLSNNPNNGQTNKDEVDASNGWSDRTNITPTTPTTSTPALTPLQNAKNGKLNAESAFNSFGNLDYTYQTQLDDVMSQILNREKFSYDINGDALYDQYKDKYIQQGKMAMMDTMGQAVAMTGGYGNSYAQSVGQQAYQSQLQNLNDIVPELYQMALDRYNAEGQNMLNQYGLLADEYARQYGEHEDKYSKILDKLNYATNEYDEEYERSLSASTTEPTKDTSITSIEDIQGWSDAILNSSTEADAMMLIEKLEGIDSALAYQLYELWEEKHKKEVEAGSDALYSGFMNGIDILRK